MHFKKSSKYPSWKDKSDSFVTLSTMNILSAYIKFVTKIQMLSFRKLLLHLVHTSIEKLVDNDLNWN